MAEAIKFPRNLTDETKFRKSEIDYHIDSKIEEGEEGQKEFIEVELTKNGEKRSAGMYVKRVFRSEHDAYRYIIKANDLRALNLPVPNTTRYIHEPGSDEHAVLISDLRENENTKVWSLNNELTEIVEMNLTDEDLDTIGLQLDEIARKAAEAGFYLNSDAYFIIKSQDEEPRVIIGDLGIGVTKDDKQDQTNILRHNYMSTNRLYDIIQSSTIIQPDNVNKLPEPAI